MPIAIPSDWHDIVQRVSSWLDDASARRDRHESEFILRFPSDAEVKPTSNAHLAERLAELPRTLEPLEALARETDELAAAAESELRSQARSSETLRLRLAEWVGRAIG